MRKTEWHIPFDFAEFDHHHSIVEKTSGLGTCWYCAVREYQCELAGSIRKDFGFSSCGCSRVYDEHFNPSADIFGSLLKKVARDYGTHNYKLDAATMERYHNEPSFSHIGTPHFLSLHPRSTRRFYSLYKHDQSKRKHLGTFYQPTVGVYWYLDMKEYTYVEGAAYNTKHKTADVRNENPKHEQAVCAVMTDSGYSTAPVVCAESARTQIVRGQWCKRVASKPEPVEPYGTPRCLPVPMEPETKPRRLSGNLSRAEMKRVLMSEEAIKEITAHVAKMLHVYSIQEQGGEQVGKVDKYSREKWNRESKWGKREMDDMVMSFVASGLHAFVERIDLDGRKRNLTRTFKTRKPIRFSGGKVAFIAGAAKWIADKCKERELWWAYRDVQMVNEDRRNGVQLQEWNEEIAEENATWDRNAWDRSHADERLTAMFSDDDPQETPHTVNLFDDPESISPHEDWEYSRLDDEMLDGVRFRKETLHYVGPPLVNVPLRWERTGCSLAPSRCRSVEQECGVCEYAWER